MQTVFFPVTKVGIRRANDKLYRNNGIPKGGLILFLKMLHWQPTLKKMDMVWAW